MCRGSAQCKHYGLGSCGRRSTDNRQQTVKKKKKKIKNMFFHIIQPKPPNITRRSQKPRNTLTENALSAEEPSPTFALCPLSNTMIIDCYFFSFSSVWWSFKPDSCCLCTWTSLSKEAAPSCAIFFIILLTSEVPLSLSHSLSLYPPVGDIEIAHRRMHVCVCICALVCKYRKQRRRKVVQKLQVQPV